MTKEKQIEEMAVVLTDGGCKTCVGCSHNNRFQCKPIYDAELLYNAGYRKQSEGEWVHSDKAQHWFGKDECNKCHYHTADRIDLSYFNFCPNCGAKMKGGESDA